MAARAPDTSTQRLSVAWLVRGVRYTLVSYLRHACVVVVLVGYSVILLYVFGCRHTAVLLSENGVCFSFICVIAGRPASSFRCGHALAMKDFFFFWCIGWLMTESSCDGEGAVVGLGQKVPGRLSSSCEELPVVSEAI